MRSRGTSFVALVALLASGFTFFDAPVFANAAIVTNNLLLNLDASNTSSLAATGATGWNSVSPASSTPTSTFFGNAARTSDSTGASISFDGSADAAVFPVGTGRAAGSMTLETWIKPGNLRAGWNIIASRWFTDTARNEPASSQDWHLALYGTTASNIKLQLNTGAGILTSNTTFPATGANKWYHVAFTIDSANNNTATLWINGVADGTVANFPHTDNSTAQLHVGDVGTDTTMPGNMSRFRIYNMALSATQVAQNYLTDSANYGYAPVNTVSPTVTGIAKVGTVATANVGTWGVGDSDGTTTTYQWQSSPDATTWTNITGATNATYTPVANDATNYLRVRVTKTNTAGSATATSAASLRVQAATGVALISGGKLTGLTTTVPNDATTYNVTLASSNLSSTMLLGTTTGLTFVGGYASTASYMATSLTNAAPIVSFRGTGTAINTALANITYTSATKQVDVVKLYYATAGTTTTDTKDYIPIYDNNQLTFHYYAYKSHAAAKDRPGMDAALVGLTTTDNVQAPGPWYLFTPRYQVEWERVKTISGMNAYFMGAKADAGSTNWYWPADTDGYSSATIFGTQSGSVVTATSNVYNQTNTTLPFHSGEPNGGTTAERSGYIYVNSGALGWDDVPANCACSANFVMETFGTAPFNSGANGVLAQTVSVVDSYATAPTGVTAYVSGTGSIVLSYGLSTLSTTGTTMTGYRLEASTTSNFASVVASSGSSTDTSGMITGLATNTLYYLRVVAITSAGYGTYSTAITATTSATASTITVVSSGGGVAGTDYTTVGQFVIAKSSNNVTVNASAIQSLLSSWTQIAADNVVISAPITWSNSTRLFLGNTNTSTVAINKPITSSGANAILAINPPTYSLDVKNGASISLTGANVRLYIGNNNYTLIKSTAEFSSVAATGYYALSRPISYSVDATALASAPITSSFTGEFDGLGNTVDRLNISATTANSYGLFKNIFGGAKVRNLGVTNAYVKTATLAGNYSVGLVAGATGGTGSITVDQVWSTGVIYVAGSANGLALGGIIGNAPSASVTISKSWSSASIDSSFSGTGAVLLQGGIIGGDEGTIGQAPTGTGGVVTLNQVYATGTMKWVSNGHRGVGGLFGIHYNATGGATITDSFSWVTFAAGVPAWNQGGIIGVNDGSNSTLTRVYQTTSSACANDASVTVSPACPANVTPGATVAAISGAAWTSTGATVLANLPTPTKPLYVQVVAPTDGSFGTLTYKLVDGAGVEVTPSSLNLTLSGTPTYTISSSSALASYNVDYVSGLTLGGTNSSIYSLNVWPAATAVTLTKNFQTVTWNPTTAIAFGSGSFTASTTPVGSGSGTISYSVSNAGTTGCSVNASTGLISYTSAGNCSITATAASTATYGVGSKTVTFVIADAAAAPTVTSTPTSTSSLLLSWNAPTVTATSGSITGYQILYSTAADMSGAVTVNTGNTNTSRLFTGLSSGTTYYFQVRAVSGSAWTGAFNTAVSGTPKASTTTITIVASGGGVLGTDYKISNGTIYTTNATASVNVADVQTALATGNVVIAAENIVVNTAITWTSNQTLTLGTSGAGSLDINDTITASGASAGLVIAPTSYNLKTQTGAEIILSGASSTLSIGGISFTLIRAVADLASVTTTGNYALAQPIAFSGIRSTSPINVVFTGTFDGLGNTADLLKITPTADGSYGFFSSLNGATVRNLGLTQAWTYIASAVTLTKVSSGIVAGESAGSTSLTQVWTTGQNTATTGTISKYTSGGLVAAATGGTLTITKSWSSVSLNTNGATITALGVGGILGTTSAVIGDGPSIAGGSVVMNQVYSTGNLWWASTGVAHRGYGGLIGLPYSTGSVTITDAFSWSPMRNVDSNYGGLLGTQGNGTVSVTRAYTTSATSTWSGGTLTSVTAGVTLGANVANLNTANWSSSGTSKLVNLPDPFRPAYVAVVAPTDGSYSTMSYTLVDGLWTTTLASLNVSASGTPTYTIAPNVANGTYNVDYVSGLTLTGTNAPYYKAFPWVISTSVTISKQNQTVTWTPTTSVNFGSGSFTPSSAPVASGGTTISYSVSNAGTTGCTVNASTGVISYTSAGDCAITATAAGTTSFFTASATVTFTIAAAAEAPTVTTTSVSTNSVLVSWTAPTVNSTSGAITGYQILYSTSSNMASPVTVNTGNTNTSRLVTGLTSGTTYYFQVRAISGSTWIGSLNTAVTGTPKAAATTITVVASGGGTLGTDYKISNGVVYTTNASANVNVADIQSALLTNGVTIAAENVTVNTAITWSTSQVLTLGITAGGSLSINDSITSSGVSGGLVITPTSYSLKVATGAEIILSGSSSTLSIGGNNYTLIRAIAELSSVTTTGYYAVAKPLTFSSTALTAAPMAIDFTGTFDGLGNTLDGMTMTVPTGVMGGLFSGLTNGAVVRNLGVTNVKITMATSTNFVSAGVIAGNVVSGTTGTVTLNKVWSTGFMNGPSGTVTHLFAGGLVGWHRAGTLNISQSWSSTNIDVSGTSTTSQAVGGLLGADVNVASQGATSPGGSFNISESYSTGFIKAIQGNWRGVGGLVGAHWSSSVVSITDSFGWGTVTTTDTVNYGGIIGITGGGGGAATYTRLYTTNSTCALAGALTGCTSGVTLGSAVTGLNTSVWSASGASTLVNLPTPTRQLYVQVLANTNGTYDTVSYQIVDGSGAVQNAAALTALGLSVSGTAAYTPTLANAPVSATPYNFAYASGLTLGGSNASLYTLSAWRDTTSVTISKLNQTISWSPNTSVSFGSGTFTPSAAPVVSGGTSVTYAVTSAGTTGCAVNSSTGALTYTSGGSCTVSATTPSSGNYLQVSASATFVIADAATAPTATVVRTGSGALSVGWTSPTVNSSVALTGYQVFYSTSSTMSPSSSVTVGNTRGWLTTGLTNGTTYYFQVRAVSGSSWYGPLSAVASASPAATTTTINVVASGGGVAGTAYTVNGGVISTTGTASINAADINSILASEGTVQLAADNVNVNAALAWSTSSVLTLGNTSSSTVNVNSTINGSGVSSGVKIMPATYGLQVKSGAYIRLTGATPTFSLGGSNFVVVNTVAGLSNVLVGSNWALTAPITLSTVYTTAVKDFAFAGTMDGLGNTINNMQLNVSSTRDSGFYTSLGGATIRNVGFTNVNISSGTDAINTRLGSIAGNGSSAGTNNVTQVWATGFLNQTAAGTSKTEAGGLFGGATAGTLNISKSWSSVAVSTSSGSVGSGGIIGTNVSTFGGSPGTGNTLSISESYSTGNILRNLPASYSWYGNAGIIGVSYGLSTTITNSFSWGNINSTGSSSGTSTAGIVGVAGTTGTSVSNSYTTYSACGGPSVTNCLVSQTAGAVVSGGTGFTSGVWQSVNGTSLTNLALPTKLLYVRVKAPTNGAFETLSYEIVDSTGTVQTLSSLNLSISGNPTYDSISVASPKGTYSVNYSSGLTLGGSSAAVYSLSAWNTATSVTITKLPQTMTWSPTTAIAFKAGSFTPSVVPTALGTPTITYAVTSAGTTGCTVNSTTGVVSYLSAGTCTVTATAAEYVDYTAATSAASFVIGAATTITIVASGGGVSGTDYTISGGVLSAGANVSVNASDLVTALASGSVQLAGNVIVNSPITWTGNNVLSLGGTSGNTVTINKKITASGASAGLVIKPATYALDTKTGASVTLSGATPTLSIGGNSYTLIKSIADLANVTAVASDRFALAVPLTYSTTLTASPVNVNFAGTFDGLGNTIDNLKITYTGATNLGFMKNLAGGTVRNLGLTNEIILLNPSTTTGNLAVGGLAGDSTGGTLDQVWTTGFLRVLSGKTYAGLGMGGLVGNVNSGTLSVSKSWSSVGLDAWYGSYTIHYAGGLVGGDLGSWSATSSTAGGSIVMNEVYATGDASTPLTTGTHGVGGLIGLHLGTGTVNVTNAFSWEQQVGNTGVNFGGILGMASGGTSSLTNVYSISSQNYPAAATGVTQTNAGWNWAIGSTPTITTNSLWYESTNGRALVNLPMPYKNFFVRVAVSGTPNGSYSDIVYRTINSVDQTKTISAFNLTVSGTPVYSIDSSAALGTYNVTYVSGLTYGGTGAYLYNITPYPFATSVTISKYAQSITLTSTAPATAAVGTTYTLTGSASSGLTVAYTIDSASASICSVSGSVVTYNALGTCTINANQAGNTSYLSATQVQQSTTVDTKGTQTISFTSTAPAAKVAGATYTPTATATSGVAPVFTIASGSASVCSISSGVVSFQAVGSCVINANEAGGANWNAATQVQQTVTVGKGISTIVITSVAPSNAVVDGATYTLTSTKTAANTNSVVYTVDSTTSTICSVAGATVTFLKAGTCKVNANLASDTQYEAATQQQQVITVGKGSQVLAFTSSAPNSAKVGGSTYTVTATGGASTSSIVLTVDSVSTSNCSVTGMVVTYLAVGDCVLNLNQAGDADYLAATQIQQTVTITTDGRCPNAVVSGNYCLVKFTAGGTWKVPAGVTSIDIVAVGGGGAGGGGALGNGAPGGGGGGEVLETLGVSVIAGTVITTSIGAGGIGGGAAADATASTNGGATTVTGTNSFATITARGGGAGATWRYIAPSPGLAQPAGSGATVAGGGGGHAQISTRVTAAAVGGVSTGGVGNPDGASADRQNGGGGGGAGGNGGNASASAAGAGGIGLTSVILGAALGGGGGGAKRGVNGALGAVVAGGGAGGAGGPGTPGTANTGGGGGGSGGANNGANGGSGVVAIRFAMTQTVAFTSAAPTGLVYGTTTTYTPTISATASDVPGTITVDSTSASVCTISAGVVSFTGAGTCTLNANQAANGYYGAATQVQQNITVAKKDQTASFSNEPDSTKVDTTYTPTGTSTSGDAVTFTIAAGSSAVCSISAGVVSFNAVGTCTVLGNVATSTNWNAATQISKAITVTKGDQVVSFSSNAPSNPRVGTTYTVSATGGASGKSVVFGRTAASSAVCSVSGSTISFLKVGSCVITANQDGSTNYTAAPEVTQTIAVGQGTQVISFNSSAPTDAVVDGTQYTVDVSGGASGNPILLTIDSASVNVCSISGTKVSFIGVGDCVVKANQNGSTDYEVAPELTQTISVAKGAQIITFTSTAPTTAVVDGETYTPIATGGATGNPVALTIDASSALICAIANGEVSFTAAGTCLINANQDGNSDYNAAVQVQQSITVGKGAQVVAFTSTAPTLARVADSGYSVTATGGASTSAVVISVASASTTNCSISSGLVSFLAAGTCVLELNQAGDDNYNAAAKVTQTITVFKGLQTITQTNALPQNAVVDGATYSTAFTGGATGNAITIEIAASSAAVCTITNGVISLIGAGTCSYVVNQAGNQNYEAAGEFTNSFEVAKGSQSITFSTTAPTASVGGTTYSPVATGGATGHPIVFRIDASSSSVCAISSGVVRFIGVGTCLIGATQAGDSNYESAQSSQSFTVSQGSQTIAFTTTATGAVVGGSQYTPAATGGASGKDVIFSIAPASSLICTLTAGKISYQSPGDCVVEANQAGNTNYLAAPTATQTISVGKGSQILTFASSAPSTAKVGGNTYQPIVTGGASTSPIVFSIAASSASVCSVSNGVVSFTGVGNCVIEANQAGDANYNAANQLTQIVSVAKGVQEVTFTSTPPSLRPVQGTYYTPTATGSASGIPIVFTIAPEAASLCAINNGVISFLAVGDCIVYANQAGNSNWNAATQVAQVFDITKGEQVVSYTSTAPTDAVVGGAVYEPHANGGAGTKPVTFSASLTSAGICSVTNGVVSFLAAGECQVVANQDSDANYNAATPKLQTITVGRGSQTISFSSIFLAARVEGAAYQPVTAGGLSSSPARFSIAPGSTEICDIYDGVVYFHAVGDCVIEANQDGDANYNAAATVTQVIAVSKGYQAPLTASASITSLSLGDTAPTSIVGVSGGSGTGVVSWEIAPSSASVCSIQGEVVTGLSVGYCDLTVTKAGDVNFESESATLTISVTTGGQKPVRTSVSVADPVYEPGLTLQLTLDGGNGSGSVWFESITPDVCSTTEEGVLTALKGGQCQVIGHKNGDESFVDAFDTLTFTIARAEQSTLGINLNHQLTYSPDGPVTATLAISGAKTSGATNFTMVSGDCTIDGNTISATAAGDCVVAATVIGDESYLDGTVQKTFTVGKAVPAATVATIASGATSAIAWKGKSVTRYEVSGGSGTGAITASTTTSDICSVTKSGSVITITGLAQGTCVVAMNQAADDNFQALRTTFNVSVLDLPAVPQSFALANTGATPTGSMKIDVSWAAPVAATTRALVTGYEVQSKTATGSWTTVPGGTLSANDTKLTVEVPAWTQVYFRVAPISDLDAADGSERNWVTLTQAGTGAPVPFDVSGTVAKISTNLAATTSGETVFITGTGFDPAVTTQVQISTNSSVFAAGFGRAALSQSVVVPATVISPTELSFVLPKISLPAGKTSLATQVRILTTNGISSQPVNLEYIPKKLAQTLAVAGLPANKAVLSIGSVVPAGTATVSVPADLTKSGAAPVVSATPASVCTAAVTGRSVTITPVGRGTCAISIIAPATPGYTASAAKAFTYTVKGATQTVTFANPGAKTFSNTPLALTAIASSLLPVSYASTSPTVCLVDGSSVKMVAAGVCSITASQPGSAAVEPAAGVVQKFTIAKANRTTGLTATAESVSSTGVRVSHTYDVTSSLTGPTIDVVVGENPLDVPVTFNKREGTILFTVDAAADKAGVCTADGGELGTLVGTITMLDVGTCKVTISTPADAAWNLGPETIVITVVGSALPDGAVDPTAGNIGDGVLSPEDTDNTPGDVDTEPAVAVTLDPTVAKTYAFGGEDGFDYDPVAGKINVRTRSMLVGTWTAILKSPSADKKWFKIKGKVVKKVQTYIDVATCTTKLTVKKDPKLKKKVSRIIGAGCLLSDSGKAAFTSVGIQKLKMKYKRIRQYAKTGLDYQGTVKAKKRILKKVNRTIVIKVGRAQ